MSPFPMITSTRSERREACPNPGPPLQPVLGTEKRNPVFSVYRQARPVPLLHLYHGAELLEVVPEDRRNPAFKVLIGQLYNAGVKGVVLQRTFRVDPKTMQRWGRALQSDEPEQWVRALAGRSRHRKLTPEIRAFIALRFPEVYTNNCRGYSQRLRAEIKAAFGITLSGECLRTLLQPMRAALCH
jgi:hypothetical protein